MFLLGQSSVSTVLFDFPRMGGALINPYGLRPSPKACWAFRGPGPPAPFTANQSTMVSQSLFDMAVSIFGPFMILAVSLSDLDFLICQYVGVLCSSSSQIT